MNDVLCDLEDVKIFVDDILIYGQGDTMEGVGVLSSKTLLSRAILSEEHWLNGTLV